jgi:hypothetical protein
MTMTGRRTVSTDDLTEVREEFERWRRDRPRGARIPAPLWRSAVALAGRHGVSKASQALHLDYYALRKRIEATTSRQGVSKGPTERFVEVAFPPSATTSQCHLELESAGGARLRIDLRGLSVAELGSLVRTVWDPAR